MLKTEDAYQQVRAVLEGRADVADLDEWLADQVWDMLSPSAGEGFARVVARLRRALADHEAGVLSDLDLRASLRAVLPTWQQTGLSLGLHKVGSVSWERTHAVSIPLQDPIIMSVGSFVIEPLLTMDVGVTSVTRPRVIELQAVGPTPRIVRTTTVPPIRLKPVALQPSPEFLLTAAH